MTAYIAEVIMPDFNLRVDDRPLAEFTQHSTEIGFGCAISIVRRGVEIIDTQFNRARDHAPLLDVTATHHQTGVSAAPEADLGRAQRCFRNAAIAHDDLGMSKPCSYLV